MTAGENYQKVKLEIHFIQIPKFKKEKRRSKTKLEQWMQFISQTNPKGVELAMKENKDIEKATELTKEEIKKFTQNSQNKN